MIYHILIILGTLAFFGWVISLAKKPRVLTVGDFLDAMDRAMADMETQMKRTSLYD